MARIERRYDAQRKLTWAKGMARDIYRNMAIANSHSVGYRVSGEARLYNIMLPRHCAYNIIGETPPPGGLDAKLPPYREWQFVLVGYGEAGNANFEVSREITGDVVVEVEMGDGKA
jgi:hypothetical protein